MNIFKYFFEREKSEAGWRFWVLWVIVTNIGFFGGLWAGNNISLLLKPVINPESYRQIESVIIGFVFASLVGILQGIVLNRHGWSGLSWAILTGLGWAMGTFISGLILFSLIPNLETSDFLRWVVPVGFIAGAILGMFQIIFLKTMQTNYGWKWILISSLAWGVFFPGAISGYFINKKLQNQPID